MSGDLYCTLVTPDATSYTGKVWQVTVPGTAGRFSIRKDHAPVVASLDSGDIELAVSEMDRRRFTVETGMVCCCNNHCTILCPAVTLLND